MFASRAVVAGATVTVKNLSAAQHTVSADTTAGGFDVSIDPGKTVTFTAPSRPGAYGFHCNIHTFMRGTLRVT
jgi:plastocyanin